MGSSDLTSILTIAELKAAASAALPPTVRDYFNEGALDMITVRDNEAAYDRYKIRPRILCDVSDVDTRTSVFGEEVPLPFGFAPAAMHGLAHPDGEKATSRAAAKLGLAMGLSTYSTVSLEDVIAQRGQGRNPYAFQLSIVKDREISLKWIKQTEAAGYKALLITVDAPVLGLRLNETRNHLSLPDHLSLPNLPSTKTKDENGKDVENATRTHHYSGRDPSNNWASVIPWVKSNTNLEIWLKGVYCAEDVLLAIRYGVAGIVVSNHGGRQLDGVPATIDALPECAAAAKGRIKIAIDGGIRRGSDIFKALALGADFCFMGRVPLWGLAYNGQDGVELAVKILEEELRITMALAGCASLAEISHHHLSVIGPNGMLCKL